MSDVGFRISDRFGLFGFRFFEYESLVSVLVL